MLGAHAKWGKRPLRQAHRNGCQRRQLYLSRSHHSLGIGRCRSAAENSDGLEMEMQLEALKPAIILVEPKMGENIGAAARAMKNFGLCDLRLVSPQDGWPNPLADATASHALDLVRSARLYDNVYDAIADLDRVYAATARTRAMTKAFVTARQLPGELHQLAAAAMEAARAAQAAAEALGAAAPSHPEAAEPPPSASSTMTSPQASAAPSESTPAPTPSLSHVPPTHRTSATAVPTPHPHTSPPDTSHAASDLADPGSGPWPVPEPGAPHSASASAGPAAAPQRRPPRAGVLFGRESSGLTNEEVAAANKVLTIEADPAYPVLNLGQAVVITAYELHQARLQAAGAAVSTTAAAADGGGGNSVAAAGGSAASGSGAIISSAEELRARAEAVQLASRGQVEGFLRRLVSELDESDFFESEAKRPATLLSIRNLAAKAEGMTAGEVALMHGMVSKLTAAKANKERGGRVNGGGGGGGRRGGRGQRRRGGEDAVEGQGEGQGEHEGREEGQGVTGGGTLGEGERGRRAAVQLEGLGS
ncbi:hypothetical protein PLESTB_000594400 [Pleodorina starrii]|uniref:tRNA/rRNA methyltransferase SpoU type domain-containing protein n=1 Tax=Pleodorina starrii TaxID=330485 RepID=A0A9W6BHD9_9CHLO|nr:hypothetical protein PLESTM_000767700 [Pleodorina starrii]GLC52202.1 hypothetical protein PLESTB_000594400 [Pleodorina starrii]GLC75832.1 hypothetical protein PLESTF_001692400 [Pleodorina starrii]